MAIITTFLGGLGRVAGAARRPAVAASLEWLGGLTVVTSFVALGFTLARAAG